MTVTFSGGVYIKGPSAAVARKIAELAANTTKPFAFGIEGRHDHRTGWDPIGYRHQDYAEAAFVDGEEDINAAAKIEGPFDGAFSRLYSYLVIKGLFRENQPPEFTNEYKRIYLEG